MFQHIYTEILFNVKNHFSVSLHVKVLSRNIASKWNIFKRKEDKWEDWENDIELFIKKEAVRM